MNELQDTYQYTPFEYEEAKLRFDEASQEKSFDLEKSKVAMRAFFIGQDLKIWREKEIEQARNN